MTDVTLAERNRRCLLALRFVLASLVAVHGWYRLGSGGVAGFGGWLDAQGWPFGVAIAASITAIEILATPVLALGRMQFALSLVFAAIYSVGLVIVHLPFGWFVVGGGRNGMEYSVLLISGFLLLAYQSMPRSRADDRIARMGSSWVS